MPERPFGNWRLTIFPAVRWRTIRFILASPSGRMAYSLTATLFDPQWRAYDRPFVDVHLWN